MFEIIQNEKELLLEYSSERGRDVDADLQKKGKISIHSTFYFKQIKCTPDPETWIFTLGERRKDYYRIPKEILNIRFDLLLHKSLEISHTLFTTHSNISIFRKIDELINEQIVIGGDLNNAIPCDEFHDIVKKFPNSWETEKYVDSRIHHILNNYFETMSDAELKYNNYLKKKFPQQPHINHLSSIDEYEIKKYEFMKSELLEMLVLENSNSCPEAEWQKKIVDFLLLLFPQYILCLSEVGIRSYDTQGTASLKRCDLMLVNSRGYIDIVEIKKPSDKCLLCSAGSRYRDNYYPGKDLSGTVMQVEKYLFHLNKWGREGEDALTKKYKSKLPNKLKIKITNPKGLIIMGRDIGFNKQQLIGGDIGFIAV